MTYSYLLHITPAISPWHFLWAIHTPNQHFEIAYFFPKKVCNFPANHFPGSKPTCFPSILLAQDDLGVHLASHDLRILQKNLGRSPVFTSDSPRFTASEMYVVQKKKAYQIAAGCWGDAEFYLWMCWIMPSRLGPCPAESCRIVSLWCTPSGND